MSDFVETFQFVYCESVGRILREVRSTTYLLDGLFIPNFSRGDDAATMEPQGKVTNVTLA